MTSSTISAMPASSGTSRLSSFRSPREESIVYWARVTISPRRTMTSPFTQVSISTASRAFWRLASVISSSMSMLGWMQALITSVAMETRGRG